MASVVLSYFRTAALLNCKQFKYTLVVLFGGSEINFYFFRAIYRAFDHGVLIDFGSIRCLFTGRTNS